MSALQIQKPVLLPPRHHFEQDSFEVFGFGNGREDGMIERLLEALEFSRRTARIDQRIGDRLGKCIFAYVMRTGKCGEQTIFR